MASNAAVPFWRAAGMTYISYSNICANLVRNCLKEPYKTEVLSREKVHFSVSKWADGKPEKPSGGKITTVYSASEVNTQLYPTTKITVQLFLGKGADMFCAGVTPPTVTQQLKSS